MYGHACSELTAVRYTLRSLAVRQQSTRLPMGIWDAWSMEPPNPRHDAHSTPPEPGRAPGGCHAVDLARVAPGFSAVTIFDPLASYVSKRTHLIFRLCRALIIHPPYVRSSSSSYRHREKGGDHAHNACVHGPSCSSCHREKRRKSGLFYSEQSASSLLRCVYTFFLQEKKGNSSYFLC
jgi:hypothetical protein